MNTFDRGIAARAAGVPYGLLRSKHFHGDRSPAVPHVEGKRGAERWSLPQIVAVSIGRMLQAQYGTTVGAMQPLLSALWSCPEDELRAKFVRGERYLVLVGATPAGSLLTHEQLEHEGQEFPALARAGLPAPVILDVASVYDRIAASLRPAGLVEMPQAKKS